jgi:hypothetical protein
VYPAIQVSAGHRAEDLDRPVPTQGNDVNADMDRKRLPHVSISSQPGITSHKRHPGIAGGRMIHAGGLPAMPPPAGEISAAIEIAATPERVWAVLTDLASYPQWNPVFREASGQVAVGNRITLTSTQPVTGHTMTVKVKVLTAEPATELRWVSSALGLMTSRRSFTLSPVNGGTRLMQTQTYRGLFTRFPPKTISRIQTSFDAINQAIKQRAEDFQ